MPQNVYSLPDLIDLALKVPEVGAVNFNILHTILQAIVKELQLTDVRPFCQIEDSFLIKASQIKAKLKEVQHKKAVAEQYVTEKAPIPEVRHHLIKETSEGDATVRKGLELSIRDLSANSWLVLDFFRGVQNHEPSQTLLALGDLKQQQCVVQSNDYSYANGMLPRHALHFH